jgi:hypothetical protein
MKNKNETIFIVSNQIVFPNSKINWPDLNYPDSGETILRYLHLIDYSNKKIQLDSANGPWFENSQLPSGVGFYKKI